MGKKRTDPFTVEIVNDALIAAGSTGGGYGDPGNRARQKVIYDVRNEYFTPREAAALFGVACCSVNAAT